MAYNPGIVGTQSTSWSQKSRFGSSFSQTTLSFEQYLINNIDGVNQSNVQYIIEALINDKNFENILKVSVAILQKKN